MLGRERVAVYCEAHTYTLWSMVNRTTAEEYRVGKCASRVNAITARASEQHINGG
jgi:hypothetical protein